MTVSKRDRASGMPALVWMEVRIIGKKVERVLSVGVDVRACARRTNEPRHSLCGDWMSSDFRVICGIESQVKEQDRQRNALH